MAVTDRKRWMRLRYWAGGKLLLFSLRVMPPSRYRSEVYQSLWVIKFRVMANHAQQEAARQGANDL